MQFSQEIKVILIYLYIIEDQLLKIYLFSIISYLLTFNLIIDNILGIM